MALFLQLALWNANDLSHHVDELQTFLASRHIDIMLISETHFKQKSYLRIPHYTVYHTNHLAGTTRGGTAIIIKNTINHHPLRDFSRDYLQASSVSVVDSVGHITIRQFNSLPNTQSAKSNLKNTMLLSDPGSSRQEITMRNTPTGVPDSSHLVAKNFLKQ
jgi:hypothetical protein